MEDRLKKLTTELAAELAACLGTPEARAAVEATRAAPDSETGTFEVVITTENVDRYQEVIKLDAWDIDHYMQNPVVLWGHDSRAIPIGIATSIDIRDGKMIAKGKFAPASANPFAQQIRELYDLGMMRATSVGFIEKEREGNLITKAELLEFSFVSIPANPYALSTMVKSGVSVNDMVTKGLVFVKEAEAPETQETVNPDTPGNDSPERNDPHTDPIEPEAKAIAPLVTRLEAAVIALEAAVETDEPERDEDEPDEDEPVDDETQRALQDFDAKRRVLQQASTILSEVLAEARRAVETR